MRFFERLFRMLALRESGYAHCGFRSTGSSLNTVFQIYLSKVDFIRLWFSFCMKFLFVSLYVCMFFWKVFNVIQSNMKCKQWFFFVTGPFNLPLLVHRNCLVLQNISKVMFLISTLWISWKKQSALISITLEGVYPILCITIRLPGQIYFLICYLCLFTKNCIFRGRVA